MQIKGLDGLSDTEVNLDLRKGGKFVNYQYCISVIILTFRRPSAIYFIRADENAVIKGLPFTHISLLAGWWGIPWGRSTRSARWPATSAAARTSRSTWSPSGACEWKQ